MKVGNREILKPMDDGCDELWVDFNLVPKVIRVYCQKHPSVDMEIKWDSMAIEASDIGRFDIERLQGKPALCPRQLIDLDLSNFEYHRIFVVVFYSHAQWKKNLSK